MNARAAVKDLLTGLAVATLFLFSLLLTAPRYASAQVFNRCGGCDCDCSTLGGPEQHVDAPFDATDTDAQCDAACNDICQGGIPDEDAEAFGCVEVTPACVCCSDSIAAASEQECRTACERHNGFKSFGAVRGPACPEGAAPAPAGAEGAPAAPQAPIEYEQGAVVTEIINPLDTTSIATLIGRVINAALGIAGSIAILMVVYGGVTWLTSGGSPEKIQKGKNILVWAVIGLAVIFGAYSVLNFVLNKLLGGV